MPTGKVVPPVAFKIAWLEKQHYPRRTEFKVVLKQARVKAGSTCWSWLLLETSSIKFNPEVDDTLVWAWERMTTTLPDQPTIVYRNYKGKMGGAGLKVPGSL